MKTDIDAVKAKVAKAQEQLEERLAALQTSDDWTATLERMAILGATSISRYSFRNIMLLTAQRPFIRQAATFNGWQQYGRSVKRGEKGLTVLRPRIIKKRDATGGQAEENIIAGFSYLTVFDLEQTEGEPLPPAIQAADVATPEGFEWTVERLRELVGTLPGIAGIPLRARNADDYCDVAGWFELRSHQIVVLTGESAQAHQLKTLLHEVAHAILHGDGERHVTATAEVEAESTAFVVAHALGLDTSSFSLPYVATWALSNGEKSPTKAVALVGERIRKAAVVIFGALFPSPAVELEEMAA